MTVWPRASAYWLHTAQASSWLGATQRGLPAAVCCGIPPTPPFWWRWLAALGTLAALHTSNIYTQACAHMLRCMCDTGLRVQQQAPLFA